MEANNQNYGRTKLKTSLRFTGDVNNDMPLVLQVLDEVLPLHDNNSKRIDELFEIYFNTSDYWDKQKKQRSDINNKIGIASGWAMTRTLNGYCFGEPIKYVARDSEKQEAVERLSQWLDSCGNHSSTTSATLTSSVCGLGYKLALPCTNLEIEESGVPFKINNEIIYPQNAFCVYTNEAISQKVLGVLIGTYRDITDDNDYTLYTCWTKYHQYMVIDKASGDSNFSFIEQTFSLDGSESGTIAYPLVNMRIPLIEVERNAFRKGDWEVATDLIIAKNKLLSNRLDDVEQVIDYVMVMLNCGFANEEEKNSILQSRLLQLKVTDPLNKPSIDILKNPIDQNGIQLLVNCIDSILQEVIGIPTRDERGGGGQDTGQAVKFRNGFRDLENNAGLIIPKMDKAEMEFIGLCISYIKNSSSEFSNLFAEIYPYDVRCKFMRTLDDDVYSSSIAFSNFVNSGMDYLNALTLSRLGTDPSEIARTILEAKQRGELFVQMSSSTSETQKTNEEEMESNNINEVATSPTTGENISIE